MRAVAIVVRRRLAGRWRVLAAAGVLLGIGFGVSLSSFGAARSTASVYDRILVASDAPDAAVGHGQSPEESERSLRGIRGVTGQRAYAGFLGSADGVQPVFTTALIAPTSDPFPLERPQLQAGRLPDPDAPAEVFVNASAAAGARLEVGQRLDFTLFHPITSAGAQMTVTIVGIGAFPMEIARDETSVLGIVVFTRAFYEQHRKLTVYSVSNVDLAPGFDARTDLAPAVTKLGHDLQSARSQERQSVSVALRPLVIALVALGLLALAATSVAAAQVVQRDRDRWRAASATLLRLGMVRGQLRLTQLMVAAVMAALTVATAVVVMLLASPLAPVGPFHEFDPAQGYAIDLTVAGLGAVGIVLVIALCAIVFSPLPARVVRPAPRRFQWLTAIAQRPATVAGLTLALRPDSGRIRTWRVVAATTLAATLLGISVACVASAVALTGTPARYGFDADVLALNQYGDQSEAASREAFADDADVAAATGFVSGTFLLAGRAVPGVATTQVKGDLTPTILRGQPVRFAGEIVVGQDTLEALGADVGNVVPVRLSSFAGADGEAAADAINLRIVGVATFPPVNQAGSDMPRLGIGALVTRETFLRLGGDVENDPEFTMVKLVDGADPTAFIARNPEGFTDIARTQTSWFTDTKPAELRQLDAAMPYLRGALAVGYAILFAVIAHALWTRVRTNRHDLAVLRALGSTRGQLDAVTAWQAAPFGLAIFVVGLPVGIALGRWAFTLFARSLDVVDDATVSAATYGTLAVATLLAVAVATLVSVVVARRAQTAVLLRED